MSVTPPSPRTTPASTWERPHGRRVWRRRRVGGRPRVGDWRFRQRRASLRVFEPPRDVWRLESPLVSWRLWCVPASAWSRFLGFSCDGDDAVAFELYGGEPPELAVTAPVVPDLEVLEHRVGELK